MIKIILSILLMLLPILASADSVEIDGIWYNLDPMAKKAEVTKNPNEYSGNVEIPPSVTYKDINYIVASIGESSFWEDSNLTSVTIPNSVTSIGDYAFEGCWNLRDIYYWAEDVPYIEDSTFESSLYIAATLHVPAVSVDAYKQTYPWSKFINTVPLTDDDPKPTSILSLKTNDNIYPVDIYSIDGKRKSQPQRGLNIIRMSNGTTKKIIKQ
jgi:hypothetical protein